MPTPSQAVRNHDAPASAAMSEAAMRSTWQTLKIRGELDAAQPAVRQLVADITRALQTRVDWREDVPTCAKISNTTAGAAASTSAVLDAFLAMSIITAADELCFANRPHSAQRQQTIELLVIETSELIRSRLPRLANALHDIVFGSCRADDVPVPAADAPLSEEYDAFLAATITSSARNLRHFVSLPHSIKHRRTLELLVLDLSILIDGLFPRAASALYGAVVGEPTTGNPADALVAGYAHALILED
jgi:hypothetical protein